MQTFIGIILLVVGLSILKIFGHALELDLFQREFLITGGFFIGWAWGVACPRLFNN